MNELFSIYLKAAGGMDGSAKGILAVRDHVIAEMKAKLDRAERALKRAGYQDLGGPSRACDCKKEISTGKAFQMKPVEPGTMTQDEALGVVMAGVDQVGVATPVWTDDQIDALARHMYDECEEYKNLYAYKDNVKCWTDAARAAVEFMRVDPVGWQLDVTTAEAEKAYEDARGHRTRNMDAVLDLCRSRIRPRVRVCRVLEVEGIWQKDGRQRACASEED